MANIYSEITAIERASRGEEVRDSIISALNKINSDGTENTSKLDNHPASYFATAAQLNELKQNLIPDPTLVEIYPDEWDDGVYSFETQFPSSIYDIYIQPGPSTTVAQLNAIGAAGIVAGSASLNTIRCVGTVPEVNIQIMVLATIKS